MTLVSQHADLAMHLLGSLGFTLNHKKCHLTPSQKMEFLGFIVNTQNMSLSLPPEKVFKLRKECRHWLNTSEMTARQLAHLIGLMSSTIPAVLPAPLHYRKLQQLQVLALGYQQEYDKAVPLTQEAILDLQWWINDMPSYNSRQLALPQAELILEPDASNQGWGAHCSSTQERTGGI